MQNAAFISRAWLCIGVLGLLMVCILAAGHFKFGWHLYLGAGKTEASDGLIGLSLGGLGIAFLGLATAGFVRMFLSRR